MTPIASKPILPTLRFTLIIALLLLTPSWVLAEKIKIGVSVPLTGAGISYGQDVKNVILFANDLLGKGRFELVIEDDQCNPKTAVAVAKKFIFIDKVAAVIGLPCSGAALAAGPIYDEARIPTISSLASSSKISSLGPYFFRTRPSDLEAARVLYNHVSKSHKRQAILAERTDFAQSLANDYEANNKNKLVSIYREDFASGESDFRPILLKIKNQGIDSLVIFTQTEVPFAVIAKQLKTLALNVPFFGAIIPGSKVFVETLGADADNLEFVTLPDLSSFLTPKGTELFERFTQKYGQLNGMHFSFPVAFESFNALQLAEQSGKINLKVLEKESFDGLFGRYSFDTNGDISGVNFVIRRIIAGKILPVE